jgi:hypothetical protein
MPKVGETLGSCFFSLLCFFSFSDQVVKRWKKNVFLVQEQKSEEVFVLKVVDNVVLNEEIKIGVGLGKKCPFLVRVYEIFNEDNETNMV